MIREHAARQERHAVRIMDKETGRDALLQRHPAGRQLLGQSSLLIIAEMLTQDNAPEQEQLVAPLHAQDSNAANQTDAAEHVLLRT